MNLYICSIAFIYLSIFSLFASKYSFRSAFILLLAPIIILVLSRSNGPGYEKYLSLISDLNGYNRVNSAYIYIIFTAIGEYLSPYLAFIVIQTTSALLHFYAFKNLAYSPYQFSLSLIIYFGGDFFVRDYGEIRNGLAASIFLYCLSRYLIRNSLFEKLAFSLMPLVFHISYALPTLLQLISFSIHKKYNNFIFKSFFIVFFALSASFLLISLPLYFSFLQDNSFTPLIIVFHNYLTSEYYNSKELITPFYFYVSTFVCFLILAFKSQLPDRYKSLIFMPFTSVALYLIFSPYPTLASRMPTLFTILNPIFLSYFAYILLPSRSKSSYLPLNVGCALFSFYCISAISMYRFVSLYS